MKLLRALISMLICFTMISWSDDFNVYADQWANAPALTISASYNNEDQTVVCVVSISDYQNLAGMEFRINYDEQALSGPGSDSSRIIQHGMFASAIVSDNGGNIGTSWISADAANGDSGNGEAILTVTFNVQPGYAGNAALSLGKILTVDNTVNNTDRTNANGVNEVSVAVDASKTGQSSSPKVETKVTEEPAAASAQAVYTAEPESALPVIYTRKATSSSAKAGDSITVNDQQYTLIKVLDSGDQIVADENGTVYQVQMEKAAGTWSVINLAMALATALICAMTFLKAKEIGKTARISKKYQPFLLVLPGIQVLVLLLTSSFGGAMTIVNLWSILMAVPLAMSCLLLKLCAGLVTNKAE